MNKKSYILALFLFLPCMSYAMKPETSIYSYTNQPNGLFPSTHFLFKIFKKENTFCMTNPCCKYGDSFYATCNDSKCFQINENKTTKKISVANKAIPGILKKFIKLSNTGECSLVFTKTTMRALCISKNLNRRFLKEIKTKNHPEFSKKLRNYPKFDVVVHHTQD